MSPFFVKTIRIFPFLILKTPYVLLRILHRGFQFSTAEYQRKFATKLHVHSYLKIKEIFESYPSISLIASIKTCGSMPFLKVIPLSFRFRNIQYHHEARDA